MRLFGSVKELFQVVWRKNGKEVTLEPAEPTVSATITIPDPGDAADEVVLKDTAQTLTQKTLNADGVDNTITNLPAANVVNTPSGNLAATDVQAALNELQADVDTRATSTALSDHLTDTEDAHDASAISSLPTGNLSATDVQSALAELQSDIDTRALDSALTNHLNDTTDAHDASAISNVPAGNLAATDVQGALNELQFDVDTRALDSDLTTHTLASTNVHGIGAASSVVGTATTQTLTNKTLSNPLLAGARLDATSVTVSGNNITASTNAGIFRITGGDALLSTISTTRANQWIILINDSGADLTIENDNGVLGILTGTEADLILSPDAALTLTYNSSAQRWNVVGGAGSGGGLETALVSANVNPALNQTHYLVDCSGGPITITLPATPQAGSVIRVSDESGDSTTNNITIAGNGNNVDGDTSFIIDVDNGWAQLAWTGTEWTVDTLAVNDGAGILSLNGELSPTQTFSSSDSSISISSASGDHDFQLASTIAGAKTFSANVTMSADLTIDTDTLYVDSANDRVSIGTTTFTGVSANADDLLIDAGASESGITLRSTTASSVRFNDTTDAGVIEYNHASNYLRMIVNGATEAMRIDSAGNVGIGTASPSALLHLAADNPKLYFDDTAGGSQRDYSLRTEGGQFYLKNETDSIEPIIVSSAGAVTLGPVTGAATNTHLVYGNITVANGTITYPLVTRSTLSNQIIMGSSTSILRMNNTVVPHVNSTYDLGAATARWNTIYAVNALNTSDQRLKDEITDLSPMLAKICSLQPRAFTAKFETYPIGTEGFVAQEYEAVFPEDVVEYSEDIEGFSAVKGIQTTGMAWEARLVKAIQELNSELQAAKDRITQLEGGN